MPSVTTLCSMLRSTRAVSAGQICSGWTAGASVGWDWARRLQRLAVHRSLHKGQRQKAAVPGNDPHHGGDLHRRDGQGTLTEGEHGQLAGILQGLGVGQCARTAFQSAGHRRGTAEAELLRHFGHPLCPQRLAQRHKVAVAALFQGAAQVHCPMGTAQRAAVGLVRHLDGAGAVMGKPVQPRLVGRRRQNHLEHRPGTEGGEGPVDQGRNRRRKCSFQWHRGQIPAC